MQQSHHRRTETVFIHFIGTSIFDFRWKRQHETSNTSVWHKEQSVQSLAQKRKKTTTITTPASPTHKTKSILWEGRSVGSQQVQKLKWHLFQHHGSSCSGNNRSIVVNDLVLKSSMIPFCTLKACCAPFSLQLKLTPCPSKGGAGLDQQCTKSLSKGEDLHRVWFILSLLWGNQMAQWTDEIWLAQKKMNTNSNPLFFFKYRFRLRESQLTLAKRCGTPWTGHQPIIRPQTENHYSHSCLWTILIL